MTPAIIGIGVFACTFLAALGGILLRSALPQHHLSEETRDTVKLGIGLIATMTALVLGLITASAKGSFDEINMAVKHAAADLIALDRTLAHYGPETSDVRAALQHLISKRISAIWPESGGQQSRFDRTAEPRDIELISARIRQLSPQNDDQRYLQSRALALGESLFATRSLIVAGLGTAVPLPFLVILLFWLTITFASFGLFAPWNGTVVLVFLLCALSVAAAVFLVLEMDQPFQGLIRVSGDPLKFALSRLNQ